MLTQNLKTLDFHACQLDHEIRKLTPWQPHAVMAFLYSIKLELNGHKKTTITVLHTI